MTSIQVRVNPAQPRSGADRVLDWFADDAPASTVGFRAKFLRGLRRSPVSDDLFRVASVVYVADKTVLRTETEDSWTRDIALSVPVSDAELWTNAAYQLERTLSFLSGDRWQFEFEPLPEGACGDGGPAAEQLALHTDTYDLVCLFSGGLDSLAGAVDLLDAGRRPIFVGHHESGKPNKLQGDLYAKLERAYPKAEMELRRLYLAPKYRALRAADPLPEIPERTTRSRSFLFLAAAIAVAESLGAGIPVFMPENGFIGINVPLTTARSGSLSTRTTHPQYVEHMRQLLAMLGLDHPIENPFRLMTKGEILKQTTNPTLLRRLATLSVSCSHAETGRWKKGSDAKDQRNCGACYPCLIRSASLHNVGWPDTARTINPLKARHRAEHKLLSPAHKTGASVQAVLDHLRRPAEPFAVLLNGSIPNGERRDFDAVYRRGRAELTAWLSSGSSPLLP